MDSSSAKQNRDFEHLEKDDDLLVGNFIDSFHNLTYKGIKVFSFTVSFTVLGSHLSENSN